MAMIILLWQNMKTVGDQYSAAIILASLPKKYGILPVLKIEV